MLEDQHLTNDELLHLADEREQLTDEARLALDAELSRRRLSTSDLDSFKQQCAAEEEADKLRGAAPQLMAHGSFGKKLFGKAKRRQDPSGLFEMYESTLWFVVLWFPVFPIATFTVKRNLERWLGMVVASDPIALERHPRNWEQILLTWVKASAVLLGLRFAYLFVISHPELLRRLFR